MKCNRVMEEYLELEESSRIPIKIKIHLFFCSKCRAEAFAMREAMDILKTNSPFATRSMSEEIMKEIELTANPYYREVSLWQWVVTGVVIFSAIILVNYSDPFIWLKEQYGRSMEIPLNIVWGFIICLYVGSFVGTHLDSIKETVEVKFKFK
jgi:predicted anti-sigma-YlaC factor YlaD